MGTLLETWVSQRVGYCVRLNSENIGLVLYDGKVFNDILKSYGLGRAQRFGELRARRKPSAVEAYKYLLELCDTFRLLKIDVDDEYLQRVAGGSGPFSVRLLYKLYEKLEDDEFLKIFEPKKIDIFASNIKSLLCDKRFHLKGQGDEDGAFKEYEDARRKIIEHCVEEIQRRRELFKHQEDINLIAPPQILNGQSFISMFHQLGKENGICDMDTSAYLKMLKVNERQRKNLEHRLNKTASKADDKNVIDPSTFLKDDFKAKAIQQSDYEKFQAKKWVQAHHTFESFFEKRFDKYVDSDDEGDARHVVRNEILRKGGDEIAERLQPKWDLHAKLYAKRKRRKKRVDDVMCRHLVDDLIEVVMRTLTYRYDHRRAPVPRSVMNDWKEAFFKSKLTPMPSFDVQIYSSDEEEEEVEEEEDELGIYGLDEYDSEVFIDREVIKLINEFNLHSYLYLVGPWDGDDCLPLEHEVQDMMVNGFIVHRLLETKYPLPVGYQDPHFDFTFKAAMSPIKDQNSAYIYSSVRNLMSKQNIGVIDVIEPMNYCLTVYHSEMGAIEEQECNQEMHGFPGKYSKGRKSSVKKRASKSGSQRASKVNNKRASKGTGKRASKASGGKRASKASGGKRASKAGGGKRASKASGGKRASKAAGGNRASKVGKGKGKKKSLGGGKSTADASKHTRDKGLQFPSLDEMTPRVNHSPAGLLGKEAFDSVNKGQTISDLLAGKMLVEFLKAKKTSLKGFALVSYPLTVSQAVLLEFLMTGRPLKTDYPVNPDIQKFISDELRPQPFIDSRFLVDWEELYTPDLQTLSCEVLGVVADENTIGFINTAKCDKQRAYKAIEALDVIEDALWTENQKSGTNEIDGISPSGLCEKTVSAGEKIEQPSWILKSHNIHTLSGEKLAHRIRTNAYDLGRFRPYVAQESYEKLKSHVINLLEWIRSERKYGRKWCAPFKCELVEENQFQFEDESEENVFEENSVNSKSVPIKDEKTAQGLPEVKRPVSYVQLLKLRTSEIMPRPNKDQMEVHYLTSSFFNKFIKCLPSAAAKKEEEDYLIRKQIYEQSLEDDDEEVKTKPPSLISEELPDSYYRVFGKKSVFDYEALDYDSITRLCRMIMDEPWDEDDPKRRSSVELFDEEELAKLMKQLPGKGKKRSKKDSRRGSRRKSSRRGSRRKSSRRGSRRKSSRRGSRKKSLRRGSRRQSSRRSSKRKSMRRGSRRQSSKNTRRSTTIKRKKSEKKKEETTELEVVEEEDTEEVVEEEVIQEFNLLPPHYPKPGEEDWVYLDEEIPTLYQILLATTWEAIEFEYLSNLQFLFYLMRTHDLKVIPYRNFIRKEMEAMMTFRDNRAEVVSDFENAFNALDPKLRRDTETKRTLHCHILTLYNQLMDFADHKRLKALGRREELINQRWIHKHLFILANLYLGLIQIEANRTIESLQLIHDYFFAMLQKPPSQERLQLLTIPKVFLPKRETSLISGEMSAVEQKGAVLPWEEEAEKPEIPEEIMKILRDLDRQLLNRSTVNPNPVNYLINRGVEQVQNRMDELLSFFESMILNREMGDELRPKILKKLSPEEEKNRKEQEKAFRKMLVTRKVPTLKRPPSEGRDSKPPKIKKKKLPGDIEARENRPARGIDASQLQMVDRLKWEWIVAVRNEIKRLQLRVDRIRKKAEFDLDEALNVLESGFEEFFHDVGWEYHREIKALEKAIKTFTTATTTGKNIQFPMILDGDRFYMGPRDKSQLLEISPPPNTPILSLPETFKFSFSQLNNFLRKMEAVSPEGILNKCFVDILEDMVTYNEEMNYEFLPPGWSELTRRDLVFIVEQVFGDDYVINWRDFLLFCVGIQYPTVEEIVRMRNSFREADSLGYENIQYVQYQKVSLWFEKDLETEEELAWGHNVKDLLFKLFRTSRKEVNYTELLLALCKGKQPEEGFGKGLSLLVGVGYVFWPDPPDWIHPRHVVDYTLIQLLHDVILKADYMTVETLPLETEEEKSAIVINQSETESEILETQGYSLEEDTEEEAEPEETEEEILWRTCVPFEACLTLFIVALRFWVCPPLLKLCLSEVESRLRELFFVQGVGSHMKAHELARSDLVRNIFQSTSAFRECYIPELVNCIVQSKRYVLETHDVLQGCLI